MTQLEDLKSGKLDAQLEKDAGIVPQEAQTETADTPMDDAQSSAAPKEEPPAPSEPTVQEPEVPDDEHDVKKDDEPAKAKDTTPAPAPGVRNTSAAAASPNGSSEAEDLQVEQDLLGDKAAQEEASGQDTPERHSASTTYGRSRRRSERVRDDDESRARRVHASASPDPETGLSDAERDKTRRRTAGVLLMILEQVESHTHSSVFEQPIKEAVSTYRANQDAPGYYSLIKEPIDLRQIKQRIKEGVITSSLELRHALTLMFANALMYNRPGTAVHHMAAEMRESTEELLAHYDAQTAEQP